MGSLLTKVPTSKPICMILIAENVNGILQSEEIYIEILLDTVANLAPSLLGNNGVKKLKSGKFK